MKIAKRVLYVVLLVVVSTELVLRADPFGVLRYLTSQRRVQYDWSHPFRPVPQTLNFFDITITVKSDGSRYMPLSHANDCRIAIVGDSMAWGWETDDTETWANLIAGDTLAQIDNWAVPGYNINQVIETIRHIPQYDGYVYLYFENDGDIDNTVGVSGSWSALITHIQSMFVKYDITTMTDNEIASRLQELPRNTFVFGFGLPATKRIARLFPMTVIPFYTSMISKRDWHPDDAGHRQIYEAIREPLIAYITNTCANSAKAVVQ